METSFLGGGGRPHLCHPKITWKETGTGARGIPGELSTKQRVTRTRSQTEEPRGVQGELGAQPRRGWAPGAPPKPKGWLEDSRGLQCHRAGGCWKGLKAPW